MEITSAPRFSPVKVGSHVARVGDNSHHRVLAIRRPAAKAGANRAGWSYRHFQLTAGQRWSRPPCSGLLFGAGGLGTLSFGGGFHRGFGGFGGTRLFRFSFGNRARLLFFALVRDVRPRRRDDLTGAFGAYALDIEVLLIGFRQLLRGAEAPLEQQ